MATQYSYPHCSINVKDESIVQTAVVTQDPLHMALAVVFCEKGPAYTPVIGDSITLQNTFGRGTFNNKSKYYNHASMVPQIAMGYGQVCIVRMVPEDAEISSLVLECTLTQGPITQYERNADGSLKTNANGDPIPQTDASNNPITTTGYTATWSTRQLASTETYNSVQSTSSTDAQGNITYTFPVIGLTASSVGAYGNNLGFRLWYTNAVNQTIVEAIDSQLYRFQPIMLPSGSSGNVQIIQDIYTDNYQDFSFMPSGGPAIDPDTEQDMSLTALLTNNYNELGPNSLDFQFNVYSENVHQIGTLIQASAPTEFGSMSPWMINIIGGVDQNGNPYSNFVVASDTDDLLNAMNSIWMTGGADGDVSETNFESLVSNYFTGDQLTPLLDHYSCPITHFYDTGYTNPTKEAILSFLNQRDDVYLQMTTFIWSNQNPPNDAAQDESAGAALVANARSYVESETYGTPTCRVSIDAQCGELAAPAGYMGGWVAPTLFILNSNAAFFSGTQMSGMPNDYPNNLVTIFKKVSWKNATVTAKQLNWDTGLNVITAFNQTSVFYASRRTIYEDDTSILSSEVFVHCLVYIKKIIRHIFNFYVGRTEPVSKLSDMIVNQLTSAINTAVGQLINNVKIAVSQTAQDIKNGYSYTVTVTLVGNMPNDVWNVIIPVKRSNQTISSSGTTGSGSSSGSNS